VVIGNFRAPWGITLNPFITVQSGRPFNVILGRDLNNDTINNERPALAPVGADCSNTTLFKCTPFGNFQLALGPNEVMIPRNFANAPGSTTVNVRVSKTWSFGSEGSSSARGNQQNQQQDGRRDSQRTMMGGGMAGRPPSGGARGGFGGAPSGGFGGPGGGNGRYNLTFSLNFQNLFNHTNFALPVGNLGSLFFGESTATSSFGGFGVGNPAYNRRIDAQIRFSF